MASTHLLSLSGRSLNTESLFDTGGCVFPVNKFVQRMVIFVGMVQDMLNFLKFLM